MRQFQANSFGLHDVLGNVSEWCADWFRADYYQMSSVDDPINESPWTSAANMKLRSTRVRRGGGWHDCPLLCLAESRQQNPPERADANVGFRVVCEIEPDSAADWNNQASAKNARKDTAPNPSNADTTHNAGRPAAEKPNDLAKSRRKGVGDRKK